MATKSENIDLEIAHFNNFVDKLPGVDQHCKYTIEWLLKTGVLQVSTAFEHALANVGGHKMVSHDCGDLLRNNEYSDAKLSSVRFSSYGTSYSAPVGNIANKVGNLRVQVYERQQDKFYYFNIPHDAYCHIPKTSNIEIPFEIDGTPRTVPKRPVKQNWWDFKEETWEDMATK